MKKKKQSSSKGNYIAIAIAFLIILALAAGAILLSFYMSGKSLQELLSGNFDDTVIIQEPDQIVNGSALSTHSLVFVGDSRTVAMRDAVQANEPGDTCTFIAKEGEGLSWLKESGMTELSAVLSKKPDAKVVLNLGVNDLTNAASYVEYYTQLFADYPDADFYIMSVNPVEDTSQYVSNQAIDSFNQELKKAFPDKYLDSYSYLLQGSFETVDGLHYTESTSLSIHYYAANRLAD